MRIGIDARFYGLHHAGIGRYAINLIRSLAKIDDKNEYILFANDDNEIDNLPNNFKVDTINVPYYSFKEQVVLPKVISRHNLDLVHFPHYNVPMLNSKTPFVVTIFDLIKHKYPETVRTTGFRKIKSVVNKVGYKVVMNWGVHHSKAVITSTNSVKNELVNLYKINPDKIFPIPLAVDDHITRSGGGNNKETLTKYGIQTKYILYVGNYYKYKNVEFLLSAARELPEDIVLVLVGARDVFRERLEELVRKSGIERKVILAGFVPDNELQTLYNNALAFVSASLIEGFGLPPLEAMANRCPAVLSSIPVHKEVCKDAALYFSLVSTDELIEHVKRLSIDEEFRQELIKKGTDLVKGYSWTTTAKETLKVYNAAV